MKLPMIGPRTAIFAAIGGYMLLWFHNLSQAEQEEAHRLAVDYAKRLYAKSLDKLTSHQLNRVTDLVKRHFAA